MDQNLSCYIGSLAARADIFWLEPSSSPARLGSARIFHEPSWLVTMSSRQRKKKERKKEVNGRKWLNSRQVQQEQQGKE